MSWLDALLADFDRAPVATAAPAKPARQAKPEIKCVYTQTRVCRGDGDPGEVTTGYYSVADGVLTMHDADGKPIGKEHRLAPDDDAHKIAGRLTKEAWSKATPNFNRPLYYPPLSIA